MGWAPLEGKAHERVADCKEARAAPGVKGVSVKVPLERDRRMRSLDRLELSQERLSEGRISLEEPLRRNYSFSSRFFSGLSTIHSSI